jgi:hypothetical protein
VATELDRIRTEIGGYSATMVTSYAFWRAVNDAKIRDHPIRMMPVLVGRFAWGLFVFVPASSACTVLLGVWFSRSPQGAALDYLGLCMCAALMALIFLIGVNVFVHIAVFGGNGGLYAGFPLSFKAPDPHGFANVSLFVASLVFAWMGATAVLVYTSLSFGGFAAMSQGGSGLWEVLSHIANGAYYALTTAAGISDAEPQAPQAKLANAGVVIIGVTYLLALFGLIVGTIKSADAYKLEPGATDSELACALDPIEPPRQDPIEPPRQDPNENPQQWLALTAVIASAVALRGAMDVVQTRRRSRERSN